MRHFSLTPTCNKKSFLMHWGNCFNIKVACFIYKTSNGPVSATITYSLLGVSHEQQQLRSKPWNRLHRRCDPCIFCSIRSLPSSHPMNSWWSSMASPSTWLEHSQLNRIPQATLHGPIASSICMGRKLPQCMSACTRHWWPLHSNKERGITVKANEHLH